MVILAYEVYDSSCDRTHRGFKKELDNVQKVEHWKLEQSKHPFLRIQNCSVIRVFKNRSVTY